jgi:hypothetical protein
MASGGAALDLFSAPICANCLVIDIVMRERAQNSNVGGVGSADCDLCTLSFLEMNKIDFCDLVISVKHQHSICVGGKFMTNPSSEYQVFHLQTRSFG